MLSIDVVPVRFLSGLLRGRCFLRYLGRLPLFLMFLIFHRSHFLLIFDTFNSSLLLSVYSSLGFGFLDFSRV